MQPESSLRRSPSTRNRRSGVVELVVHSGIAIAAIAGILFHACAAALGGTPGLRATLTVVGGALAVYAFDRRIDDAVDRPARAAFDRRHRRVLTGISLVAAIGAVAAGIILPPPAIALLGGVAAMSVVHARARRVPWVKPLYVAAAWLAVVVALPAILLEANWTRALAELAPIGLAIGANVIACDAVDREAEAVQIGVHRAWWVARAIAAIGAVAAFLGPASARPLVVVPAAMAIALVPFRPRADYKPALDAAVGLGAAVAWFWMAR